MNDLVIVDKDKFYITQYIHSRDYNKAVYEIWLLSHVKYTGKVFYYGGERAREVVSDLFVPNGINISPDKS